MDLKKHYNNLYLESIKKIKSDGYEIDYQIDSLSDNRLGITVVIRPSSAIKNKIQAFLDEIKKIDSEQYFYPDSDIHTTVLSIISCYKGFDVKTISVPDYIAVIEKSLLELHDLEINFQGVTASGSAVMIQGFMNNNSLNDFRNSLRNNFANSGLESSIDKRYSIATAHSTVVRFRKEISDKQKLIEILEKYRNYDFGTFHVKTVNLVCNDWYQRKEFVQELHEFTLK